jgi:hypothetical protein
MPNFELAFPEADIALWAKQYEFGPDDRPNAVGAFARNHGYLNTEQLFEICDWKSNRRSADTRSNNPQSIEEITRFAFTTEDELGRIGSLTLLKGVGWPSASVILHFCVSDDYPILDVRAIWSLSAEKPSAYSFDYWWAYVAACRQIAAAANVSIRQLDKALWQYSRENQLNTD